MKRSLSVTAAVIVTCWAGVVADRVNAKWQGWADGKPSAHAPTFNLARKRG